MKKYRWVIILLFTFLILIGILLYYLYYSVTEEFEPTQSPGTEEVIQPSDTPKKPKPTKPTDSISPAEIDSIAEEVIIEELDSLATEVELITEEIFIDESKPLHIPHTRSIFNTPDLAIDNLPSGKVYFHSGKRKIESIVIERENKEIHEYLLSFDTQGNKVDELVIGLLNSEGQRKTYAVISRNKISTFTVTTDKDGKTNETVTEYTITPTLKFSKGKTYTKVL